MTFFKKVILFSILILSISLTGCGKHNKSVEYFKKHPDKVKEEAKFCVALRNMNEDCMKYKSCRSLEKIAENLIEERHKVVSSRYSSLGY